jgi:hypothetical protein
LSFVIYGQGLITGSTTWNSIPIEIDPEYQFYLRDIIGDNIVKLKYVTLDGKSNSLTLNAEAVKMDIDPQSGEGNITADLKLFKAFVKSEGFDAKYNSVGFGGKLFGKEVTFEIFFQPGMEAITGSASIEVIENIPEAYYGIKISDKEGTIKEYGRFNFLESSTVYLDRDYSGQYGDEYPFYVVNINERLYLKFEGQRAVIIRPDAYYESKLDIHFDYSATSDQYGLGGGGIIYVKFGKDNNQPWIHLLYAWREYHNEKYFKTIGNKEIKNEAIPDLLALDTIVISEDRDKAGSIKIGLILDSSGSMNSSDPYDIRKRAAESIIDILKTGDEVFIVDFDSHAKFLNRNQTRIDSSLDLKTYIRQIDSKGGTDIGAGLSGMAEAVLSGEELNYHSMGVLLLTDGQGNYNEESNWFKDNSIPVYTVSYKQNADADLMNKIAGETGGVYVQADSKDDVIHAFMQFYYGVTGNSTIFREEVTTDGVYETGKFYIDESAENIIIYLANLDFDPSSIELFAPGQDPILLSDIPDLVIGDDYLFARTPVLFEGEYSIRVSPLFAQQFRDEIWSVSAGGPSPNVSFSSAPVSFVIEVSTDTKVDVDLAIKDSKNGCYEIEFLADKEEVKLSQSSVEMEVISPAGVATEYSKEYKNGKISFVPMEGEGTYKIKAAFMGIDVSGNVVNRHYYRSVIVGDFQPGYMGEIDRIMGNYIYTSQGSHTRNRPGITVEVFNRSSGIQNPVGKGYVTEVLDNSCIIELQEVYGEVEAGDLVILDLKQWKGDN